MCVNIDGGRFRERVSKEIRTIVECHDVGKRRFEEKQRGKESVCLMR